MGLFGPRREQPLLQAYGKLPIAKDYLRVGAGDGSGRQLRDWLDHHFSGAAGGAGPGELDGSWRFVTGGRGAPLQGLVRASHDAEGLRRFPFALFIERNARVLREELAADFTATLRWWARLAELDAAATRFADGAALLQAWRGLVVEPAGGEPEEAATTAIGRALAEQRAQRSDEPATLWLGSPSQPGAPPHLLLLPGFPNRTHAERLLEPPPAAGS